MIFEKQKSHYCILLQLQQHLLLVFLLINLVEEL